MRAKILFAVISALLLTGCRGLTAKTASEERFLLDTLCMVTVYGTDDASIPAGALDVCAEYEALLSRTMEGSDIWRINHAGGAATAVDPRTAALIRTALEFGDLSAGAFDITVGRLCALWDFNGSPAVPSARALEAALRTVDYRRVTVTDDMVQLANPEAWLDLGGIAKGYIADRAAEFLRQRGVAGAVINLGGNVVTVGAKPDGSRWRVGVRRPFGGSGELLGALNVGEASIVTSGVYERQFVADGVMYHHILDPGSGMPSTSDIVSATVVAESSAAGDALSTILILSGSGRAEEILSLAPDIWGAVLVLKSGDTVQYGDTEFIKGE